MGLNKHVDFFTAKLLKEKLYNEEVRDYYEEKDGSFYHSQYFRDNIFINEKHKGFVVAPTIADVVMWLYEKHRIWIIAFPELFNGEIVKFYPSIFEQGVGEDIEQYYNSPTEAYEAAIEYTLNNLI